MKTKAKWELLKDIPNNAAKKGMIFEWNPVEDAYTTKDLPWFLTPIIPFTTIAGICFKRERLFKKLT